MVMSRENDGGPAFPVAEQFDERRGEVVQYASEGMSLRDYFAGKFMAAFLHRAVLPPGFDVTEQLDFTAKRAYECADTLLRAR